MKTNKPALLSKESLVTLKKLYIKKYNIKLSEEEVTSIANGLVELIRSRLKSTN